MYLFGYMSQYQSFNFCYATCNYLKPAVQSDLVSNIDTTTNEMRVAVKTFTGLSIQNLKEDSWICVTTNPIQFICYPNDAIGCYKLS